MTKNDVAKTLYREFVIHILPLLTEVWQNWTGKNKGQLILWFIIPSVLQICIVWVILLLLLLLN